MNSNFENSISIIKNNNPALYSKIKDSKKNDNINVINSGSGDKIPIFELQNKKIFIHSKFDPYKEASRFIAEVDPSNFDLFIVFGFGFAYHIEELVKKISLDSILLVVEKEAGIIQSAISYRDLTNLLRDNRIKILVDPDEDKLSESLKGKSSRRVSFLTHRGSFQIDPEYYSNLRKIIKSYLSTKEVNIATLSKFEKTWTSNIARNVREFISLPGANIFYNKFKNIPAIVTGAGPSLTKSLDFIKENQNKSLIICVDTSYLILRRHGIMPHFCVTVDPQLINARYFEGDVKGRTVFIADPTVHPSVFRLIKGRIASVGMAFEMMKWIEDIAGRKGELAYGGSVMTNAYDFAKRTGASPVVLVGQDLAFTGGLAHARGSYLDEQIHLRVTRFFNAHMQNRFQLTALPKIKIKAIRSGDVHTNQKLMIFLNWFEKRNDPDLINASYDGAFIKGVKHVLTEDINFNTINNDFFKFIDELYNKSDEDFCEVEAIKISLLNRCRLMINDLDSLLEILKRAVSLSLELIDQTKKEHKDSKLDYILKKLSEADQAIESKNTLRDMIGFTVQRVIHTITEGYEIDDGDKHLSKEALVAKKSHFLYKGILEGSEFNMKILKKMISLLEP